MRAKNESFSKFGLKQEILDGLIKSGFRKPSPIQAKAITPGRMGTGLFFCLIAQLKYLA